MIERLRRLTSRLAACAVWSTPVGSALAWAATWTPTTPGLLAGAFLFHIGLVTLAAAISGAIGKRWRAALFAAVVTGLLVWPDVLSVFPRPTTIAVGPKFRVMSINLEGENRDLPAIASAVAAVGPDVLCLQEITPYQAEGLAFPTLPNRLVYPHPGYDGMAVYSRFPLRLEATPVMGTPRSWPVRTLRAAVTIDGREIEVVNVHLMAVMNRPQIARNRFDAAAIADTVRNETRPTLVVGDSNLTDRCPPLTPLLDLGFRDAHTLAGRGRGSTWPADRPWARPLPGVRIDHVFVSHQLTATDSQVGGDLGSDHYPLWADIGFRRSR